MTTKLYGISDAAREIGVSEGTLRRYDKMGIIHPTRVAGNQRIFTEADVSKARAYREKRA